MDRIEQGSHAQAALLLMLARNREIQPALPDPVLIARGNGLAALANSPCMPASTSRRTSARSSSAFGVT
jgi:hypothetical protein